MGRTKGRMLVGGSQAGSKTSIKKKKKNHTENDCKKQGDGVISLEGSIHKEMVQTKSDIRNVNLFTLL